MQVIKLCGRIGLLLFASLGLAARYIDPNTGGMLFQLLAGFFAIFTAIVLFFSRQIRVAFARFGRFLRGISSR